VKLVERSEVLGLGKYEEIREQFRARIIRDKQARRLPLGPNMTVLFENHDTVLYQIQEMIRTERITQEAAVMHEIDTYNQLVPAEGELSATVFIEYSEREERDRMLAALAGVERCFYLDVGGQRCSGVGEIRGEDTQRTTAVQYVKFPLGAALSGQLVSGTVPVVLGVDHAAYSAESTLSGETLAAVRADLQ
jgi:hypothetical protein